MSRCRADTKDEPKLLGTSGLTYADAVQIQLKLAGRVRLKPPRRRPSLVAGADVAFDKAGGAALAGLVLFSWPALEVVDVATARVELSFPYVPGLLSFREIPAVLAAYRRIAARPDVIFCDGQGIAHPRRFGLASHLGVILDIPTVGCAKSVLVGKFDEPGSKRGASSPMRDEGEVIGLALRTRDCVKPVYVSPGHMMDVETAARLVLEAGSGYRLPEPTRAAHNLVTRAKATGTR